MKIIEALNQLVKEFEKQAQEVPDSNAASKSTHPTEGHQDPNIAKPPAEGQHGQGESQALKSSIPQGVDNTTPGEVTQDNKPVETNKTIPAEPAKEQTPSVANPEPQTTAQLANTGDLGAAGNSDHPTNDLKSAEDINKLAQEIINAFSKDVKKGGDMTQQAQINTSNLSKEAQELVEHFVKEAEQDAEMYVNYLKGWTEGLQKQAEDEAAEDIIENIPPEDIADVLAEEVDKLEPEEAEEVLKDLVENEVITPEEVEQAADIVASESEEEEEETEESEETEETPSEEEVAALSEAIPEEVAKAAAALDELGVPAEEIDKFLEKNSKEYQKIKNREKIASLLGKVLNKKEK